MKSSRIKALRATQVSIPLVAPYRWSVGIMPGFSRTIVEIESDDGVVGIGETSTARDVPAVTEAIGPRLVGANPYDLADCERRGITSMRALNTTHDDNLRRVYGGVEMALWDLVGKLEGRSVASLLGGRVRDKVAFSEYFGFRVDIEETPDAVARFCAKMREEHGSPLFEGKVGAFDIATDRALVREVRAAIGEDAALRVDANMKWTITEAREALRAFEPYNIASIEEPVATLHELAQLRTMTDVPFSMHELNLQVAVKAGVPNAFVTNLTTLGGIRRTIDFARACAQFGINLWFYSPDTGIANAAYLQVAAAVEELSQPSQTLLRWHADEIIAEGLFQPENGYIAVPDRPGLGVTLDPKAMQRCHERFVETGGVDHYSYVD